MINVLVFPCGSEIGLEVNRALSYSTYFTLFGGSSIDDHGKFVYKNYISGLPFVEASNFIEEINNVVKLYGIDFIIPAHDSVVLKLAENQQAINSVVVTSCFETARICRSKMITYELFKNLLPTPVVYETLENSNFPLFLKPDVGEGSKGTYKIYSKEEYEFYLKKDPTLLALEYLPGKEYTIDCFTDKSGKLLFAEGRERKRICNGISVNSKLTINPKFQELANVINLTLSFQGVWFFQVKERQDGELVLMEISPRIAGTMALFRVLGVNFIQLSLFDRMGYDVSIIRNDLDIEIDRALFARYCLVGDYDYVYVDFDDTIVVNDNVNSDVIKFLFQAKNMNKKLILITKHRGDIYNSLSEYALSERLFDEIIQLKPDDIKSDFINNRNAIFIDDSFAERRNVLETLKIPCFGVDAIESLLSWKT